METQKDPEIIDTRAASITSVATVDVTDASKEGLALMRERVENQKQMLKIALSLTAPNQWTVFAGTGKDGVYRESIYPTGGAADTILRRAFGLTWGPKTIKVYRNESGELEASCTAWLMQGEKEIEEFTGYRQIGGFIRSEPDLRKGAMENMKSCAVRDLLGLRFRSPSELRELGLDVGKLERRAEFQSHGDDDAAGVKVPWGKLKGTPITELRDDQLGYYIGKAKEAIADPEKAKWKAKEGVWLGHLEAEKKRRIEPEKPAAEAPAAGAKSKTPHPDDLPPFDEGEREAGQEG